MQSTTTERPLQTTLGDLIALFYREYLDLYGDEELASLATAATINDLIADSAHEPAESDAA